MFSLFRLTPHLLWVPPVGRPCSPQVDLPGQGHGCWSATVTLDDGTVQTIYDYAFDFMAEACNWPVATEGHSTHGPIREDQLF